MPARINVLKTPSVLLTIGALYFGVNYFVELVSEITRSKLGINYFLVSLSGFVFLLFYVLLSFHWYRLSSLFAGKKNLQYLSFFASQPYKYLPTSLFTLSFRAKYAKDLGMDIKKSSLAQLIENLNMLSTGILVGAVFYLLSEKQFLILGLLFAVIVSVWFFTPKKLNLNIKSKVVSIDKNYEFVNLSLTSLAWIVSGFSFLILAKGLNVDIGIYEALSANALAYTLGILAFFAPGGIGVREWVFSLYSISNVAIVGWRIMTFCADMLLGFIAIGVIAIKKSRLRQ
jgi:uncharacterized membrane protein YbhN (UPF0104 family)